MERVAANAARCKQPRHWRDRYPRETLPNSANPHSFETIFLRVFLKNMKNKSNEQEGVPGASQDKQEKGTAATPLPRLEMYAVLGLELAQKIYEKLEKVEDSLEILARQKARELNPDKPDSETAS